MSHIKIIDSQKEIKEDFLQHFKQYKVFQQKSFYFDGGGHEYYSMTEQRRQYTLELKDFYFPFLKAHAIEYNKRAAIVSLGCGNSEKEKFFLDTMYDKKYEFLYIGIDASNEMIELSEKMLANVAYPVELLQTDFSKESGIECVRKLLKGYDIRIYSFIGGTLGNVEQDYIADTLFDMLDPGDKLLIEVAIRVEKTEKNDRLLFERYVEYLDTRQHFYFTPLQALGVPISSGEMFLQMVEEESLGALRFTFRFRILKKTIIIYKGRTITLLPGTIVDLMSIRVYDPLGLVHFFEERKFQFIAKQCNQKRGQFLFERK